MSCNVVNVFFGKESFNVVLEKVAFVVVFLKSDVSSPCSGCCNRIIPGLASG